MGNYKEYKVYILLLTHPPPHLSDFKIYILMRQTTKRQCFAGSISEE